MQEHQVKEMCLLSVCVFLNFAELLVTEWLIGSQISIYAVYFVLTVPSVIFS